MFSLSISDEELEAEFNCPFCGTTQEWPFGARILWKGMAAENAFPAADHVIMSHWLGDWNLNRFGFTACTKQHAWTTTTWERVDRDRGKVLDSGTVQMVDGFPHVVKH